MCVSVCIFAISSANSQQIFIKFSFPESSWNFPGLWRKKIRKYPDSGKKPEFCVSFFGHLAYNSQQIFVKFGFPDHPLDNMVQKIPENPDSGKTRLFRIFSEMVSMRYFMITKCFFSFFEIPILYLKQNVFDNVKMSLWISQSQTDPWISKTDNERTAREARLFASVIKRTEKFQMP